MGPFAELRLLAVTWDSLAAASCRVLMTSSRDDL
jgi:hypothetical protein